MGKTVYQMKYRPHNLDTYDEFIANNFVSIGWPKLGNLKGHSKDAVRNLLVEQYDYDGAHLGNSLGSIWCFYETMQAGDVIVVRKGKFVSVGILGDYCFDPSEADYKKHQRAVEWMIVNEKLADFAEDAIVSIAAKIPRTVSSTHRVVTDYDELKK